MNEFNQEGPPEQDPDFAALQARSQSNSALLANLPLPVAAFVASLNGLTGPVNLAGGTTAGVTVNITPGVGTITISVSGINTIATKKSNLTAVVDPAVTDDSSLSYAAGSFWLNTVTPSFWMAASVAVGAAVWLKLSP
jgi:hypothetical protein